MPGETDPPIRDRYEVMRDRRLEDLRRRYFRKLNPLYVWNAVVVCNLAGHPRRPLPKWCVDRILTFAVHMKALGELNNPKTFPYPEPGDTQDTINDRISEWRRQKITPTEAVAMLPSILEVTRPGWNAFAQYASEELSASLASLNDDVPNDFAMRAVARVARTHNIEPEAVQRRIRQGRKLRKLAPLPPDRFPPE